MIANVQNEIFNDLYITCPNVAVVAGNPEVAPSFPCITFVEKMNTSYTTFNTAGEYANDVMFEINIFVKSETPVADCLVLRNQVDSVMSGKYRMTRTFSDSVPNYNDNSIYRYVIRYQCIIDKNNKIFRG